eukprot:263448-Chlamydomonas_euryale.AAC.1
MGYGMIWDDDVWTFFHTCGRQHEELEDTWPAPLALSTAGLGRPDHRASADIADSGPSQSGIGSPVEPAGSFPLRNAH